MGYGWGGRDRVWREEAAALFRARIHDSLRRQCIVCTWCLYVHADLALLWWHAIADGGHGALATDLAILPHQESRDHQANVTKVRRG